MIFGIEGGRHLGGAAVGLESCVDGDPAELDSAAIASAFVIGRSRTFDEDPRFGLIALAEIGSRALSTSVNDPGTAIMIIGVLVRLFSLWLSPSASTAETDVQFDRVGVPELSLDDMFCDAFQSIARDGASCVEVAIRLQKALRALAAIDHAKVSDIAARYSSVAIKRSEQAMMIAEDIQAVKEAANSV